MRWRPSPSYSDYEISEFGDVRRVKGGYGPKDIYKDERPKGYYSARIQGPNGWKHVNLHRLVAEAFIGPCPGSEYVVAHTDGNGKNNHYSNLRWATRRENEQDKIRHGRNPYGSKAGASVLVDAEVVEIRAMIAQRIPQTAIAARFGVSRGAISGIATGRSWSKFQ